jgi:peptidoglycan hydrolase CwlO-like protein
LPSIKFIDNYLFNYRYFLEKDLENFQEQCDRIQNEYNELVSKLEETSKENQKIVEESTIMKK